MGSNDCAAARRRRKATLEERSPPLPGQELRKLESRMRKLIAFVGLLGVIYALALQHGVLNRGAAPSLAEAQAQPSEQAAPRCDERTLASAYRNHASRVEVCARGVTAKVLKDD